MRSQRLWCSNRFAVNRLKVFLCVVRCSVTEEGCRGQAWGQAVHGAAGPGARDESGKLVPLDLKVGDNILFGKWSGSEVKIDGEDLLIMKESDVLGVVA